MAFIPQIVQDGASDSRKDAERAIRRVMTEALGSKVVAQAIAPFKTDGVVKGHRVLDDNAAVRALVKEMAEHQRAILTAQVKAQNIDDYRLTQLLNAVLRRDFEMTKGKLTGNPSPRKLKLLEEKKAKAAKQAEQKEELDLS